jgi:hypothetical protein
MAIVFEEYNTEEQRSVVRFFVGKGFNANDIHKEMFTVYCAKCDFHLFGQQKKKHLADKYFADDEEVETEVRKWQRQQ